MSIISLHSFTKSISTILKKIYSRSFKITNTDLKSKFTEIYKKNLFLNPDSKSGEGSNLIQTTVIRKKIPELLKQYNIKSIIDAPCGDWHWMQHVDLNGVNYLGLDIVDELVKNNNNKYGNDNIHFSCLNIVEKTLPQADLIFCRDCLVHLSYKDALKAIQNFKNSGAKYLLTTTFTDRTNNKDLGNGFWRPLNKQLAPFNFPKPLAIINEECTEGNNRFTDKCLGLWILDDIILDF